MNIAVIDVGSAACRLLTAYVHPDGRLMRLDSTREELTLGRDVFDRGAIDEGSLDRTLDAFGRALARARCEAGDRVTAVATSPVREAVNGTCLLGRVWREHGLWIDVLSGEDEAALTYRGARSALHAGAGRVAVVKLGNGSVELAAGDGPAAALAFSLPLGALRLRDLLGLDRTPLRPRHVDLVGARVHAAAERAAAAIRDFAPERLLVSSGTARAVASLAAALPGADGDEEVVTLAGVHRLAHVLAHASPRALARLRERAPRLDRIGVGAVVLGALLEQLRVPEAQVVGRGFREGVVLREHDRIRQAGAEAAARAVRPTPHLAIVA